MAPRIRRRSSSARRANEMIIEQPTTSGARCNSWNNLNQSMVVDEPQLFIKTGDAKKFLILKSQAPCFNAFHMITKGCTTNIAPSSSGDIIHLENVHSSDLIKVMEWTELHCSKHHSYYDDEHQGHGKGTWTSSQNQTLSDSAKAFLASMTEKDMLKMMNVANFLDVRCLFGVCCKTIGKRWEGKQVEELRRLYNIENDFSTDEETAMKLESKRLGLQ